MISPESPVVILGAGAIGCYLGAQWAAAGVPVTLLGRDRLLSLNDTGFAVEGGPDFTGAELARNPKVTTEPAVLANAGLIVLTVKSTALDAAVSQISTFSASHTPVLCLLNGIAPVRRLAAALPEREISAGMVPFNVVWRNASTLRRSSVGEVILERSPATRALSAAIGGSGISLSDDIRAVQYGKLLLNLNNPVNALSGKSLYHQLRERPYRLVYAAALQEALDVYEGAQIAHAKSGPLPANRIVQMLRAPDWLFNTVALRLQKLDPQSQTSMAQDLAAGKPTEIDTINGEIVDLATATGQIAPVNTKLVELVKSASAGGQKTYTGAELHRAVLSTP
ncbi:2-dehydropantoate 2-reductase [Neptunicoccus cionae]|uniref:2-dehydropantoate 2-reductase n=1 Tax=Neptunicoccus cionae TaxID=2035344 RepID=A0A916VR88_9RHOB|nr:2-dehydropantoate 2-reductase [Amylibacter cionae]GGA21458.1 2-dehydropantoate 2-reductase [Amylibacter cionae]